MVCCACADCQRFMLGPFPVNLLPNYRTRTFTFQIVRILSCAVLCCAVGTVHFICFLTVSLCRYPIFCQIFTDETDICLQFWMSTLIPYAHIMTHTNTRTHPVDVKNPLVRPLLDDAIRRFPLQPIHLLEMLTSLCGQSVQVSLRMRSSLPCVFALFRIVHSR